MLLLKFFPLTVGPKVRREAMKKKMAVFASPKSVSILYGRPVGQDIRKDNRDNH